MAAIRAGEVFVDLEPRFDRREFERYESALREMRTFLNAREALLRDCGENFSASDSRAYGCAIPWRDYSRCRG